MIRFESDYLEGAVPEIMSRLIETNYEQTAGYGVDPYCRAAREKIKLECNAFDADIHFLVGGTQANLTVIAASLRPHQGVMAAETAHIEAHETGAIEATGHKVITLPTTDGKISAADVKAYVLRHRADESFEHIVQPAMVYISQPTETGTVYSLPELEELSSVCRELGLILFADGARLSCALACEGTPTLRDLARLCDVFYIGGTKHGALFGEAVVIKNAAIKKDFRYIIKQHGGMFAKGRLLGLQFDTLFTDGLYYKIGKREVAQTAKLRAAFEAKGIEFAYPSPTNQLFPILSKPQLDALREKYSFSVQSLLPDGGAVVRFCTSFSELLDAYYSKRDILERRRRRSKELSHHVKTARDRIARKLAVQKTELQKCSERDEIRRNAELLTANLYRVKKGDSSVTVEDYYEPDCPQRTIKLDVLKTPQNNAAAMFKEYNKLKTAQTHLTALIADGEKQLEYLNSVLDETERAETEDDLAEIKAELVGTGYIKKQRGTKERKHKKQGPMRFASSDGFEILVGRSNAQNDELTTKTARRTDIWLHTKTVHGSHVIISCDGLTPPEKTIEEAASLAVFYSQAREGGKTQVDYTMVRNVRKPSGSLPGKVIYTDYSTISVSADEALAEKLRVK